MATANNFWSKIKIYFIMLKFPRLQKLLNGKIVAMFWPGSQEKVDKLISTPIQ